MDEFYDQLTENGIQLVEEQEEQEDANADNDKKRKKKKFDLNDLSVPPGVKINDPVRMYLKEIGRVDFFCRR